jgi:hypothetical protein
MEEIPEPYSLSPSGKQRACLVCFCSLLSLCPEVLPFCFVLVVLGFELRVSVLSRQVLTDFSVA